MLSHYLDKNAFWNYIDSVQEKGDEFYMSEIKNSNLKQQN